MFIRVILNHHVSMLFTRMLGFVSAELITYLDTRHYYPKKQRSGHSYSTSENVIIFCQPSPIMYQNSLSIYQIHKYVELTVILVYLSGSLVIASCVENCIHCRTPFTRTED
jgi:hypothetical protein